MVEAAVIGVPDKVKGAVPLGLCVIKHGQWQKKGEWMHGFECKFGRLVKTLEDCCLCMHNFVPESLQFIFTLY